MLIFFHTTRLHRVPTAFILLCLIRKSGEWFLHLMLQRSQRSVLLIIESEKKDLDKNTDDDDNFLTQMLTCGRISPIFFLPPRISIVYFGERERIGSSYYETINNCKRLVELMGDTKWSIYVTRRYHMQVYRRKRFLEVVFTET